MISAARSGPHDGPTFDLHPHVYSGAKDRGARDDRAERPATGPGGSSSEAVAPEPKAPATRGT